MKKRISNQADQIAKLTAEKKEAKDFVIQLTSENDKLQAKYDELSAEFKKYKEDSGDVMKKLKLLEMDCKDKEL